MKVKTKSPVLSDGENHVIRQASFHPNTGLWQTDGRTDTSPVTMSRSSITDSNMQQQQDCFPNPS